MGTRVWKLSGEGGEEWDWVVGWSKVGGGVRSRTYQGRECGKVDVSCMGLVHWNGAQWVGRCLLG